jgi:manganese/iron transport system substrate-binding protein
MLNSFSLKNRVLGNAIVLVLTVGLASCTPTQPATDASPKTQTNNATLNKDKPKVVVTTSVLCDVTKEIAQDTINLICLIPPGSDPHVYEAKPAERKAIEQAKLILYSGYSFEPILIKLIQATKNSAPKIAVSEVAVTKPLKGEEQGHDHEKEKKNDKRAEADNDHSEFDPHVWHNAQNGIRIVETVRDNLEKISPSNATTYTSNAKKMTDELMQLDRWIKSQISTIPVSQRKLITTHDALGYYSNAYGIPLEGALQGLSTDEKPTAGRVKELVEEIKKAGVSTIFAEATVNPKLIKTVAKEANVKVSRRELFADGLGEKGTEADTYKKMLMANTQAIVEGLGGKYTPFPGK